MGTPITDIIGKRDAWGGWEVKPVAYAEHRARLQELELSTPEFVELRLREDVKDATGSRRKDIQPVLDSIRETGKFTVVIDRQHIRKQRRMKCVTAEVEVVDGVARVPFRVATVILARDKYAAVLEEVGNRASTSVRRNAGLPAPAELAEVRDLRAEVAKLTALVAKLAAPAPEEKPTELPPPRKRKSKAAPVATEAQTQEDK